MKYDSPPLEYEYFSSHFRNLRLVFVKSTFLAGVKLYCYGFIYYYV